MSTFSFRSGMTVTLLTAALTLPFSPVQAQDAGTMNYHIVREIKLGGDGGWDYLTLDTVGHRLFLARQTRIMVIDPARGKSTAEIAGLNGAHGVALDYATGHGFATSGRDSMVTMFDLKTLRVLARIKAAEDADAILYDPASKRVFTFNGDAHSSTVIDPVSGRSIGTVVLSGKPEFGVSAGNGKLYVNLEDKNTVAEIDAKRMKVTRQWPLAPCESPTGLAIDRQHHRVFSGCRNKVMAISDAIAGKVITSVPIGEGVDASAFDPGTQLAFASNGDGTLTVVHEDTPNRFRVTAIARTRRGARTMALDERTHQIYTVTAEFGPTPKPTTDHPHPRPTIVAGSVVLLVLDR